MTNNQIEAKSGAVDATDDNDINKAEQLTKCVQIVILDKYDYKLKIIVHRKKVIKTFIR